MTSAAAAAAARATAAWRLFHGEAWASGSGPRKVAHMASKARESNLARPTRMAAPRRGRREMSREWH